MLLELLLMLTPINGAIYNTRALQQANYANIQVRGGTLYGVPKLKSAKLKPSPVDTGSIKLLAPNVSIPSARTTLPNSSVASSQPYYNKALTGTGIQLDSSATDEQKKIAAKYSPYFKEPIAISLVPNKNSFTAKAINDKGNGVYGENIVYGDGSKQMEIDNSISPDKFEFTMLHEIGHNIFHYDEPSAWNYAKQMISMYGTQR